MDRRNNSICLNGKWQFMFDGDDSGGEKGYMLKNCDLSRWRECSVPCTYESAAQERTGYRGTVWFRRYFTADDINGGLLWLEFAAVNYRADVWINEHPVGSYIDDYLPFRFEISKYVVPGENLICVRVNNRVIPGMLPPSHFWRGHGGIIRKVSLYGTPSCYINTVRLIKAGDSLKAVTEVVNDSDDAVTAHIRHYCPENGIGGDAEITVLPKDSGISEVVFPADKFSLWDPGDPVMYSCDTEMTVSDQKDSFAVSFGVREISAENDRIFLNGKELRLRGFNRHEDSPHTMNATDVDNSEWDFRKMKEMNANFVRFCHYPHSEEELDICDRLGLLVLAEIPLNAAMVGIKEYNEAETVRALPQLYMNAKNAARRMVERDYNHPCVIFWSVSNESNESNTSIRQMNEALIQYVRKLDGSRFAVHVSQGCWWENRDIADLIFAQDDVICINAYVTMEHKNSADHRITEDDMEYARSFWDRKLAYFNEKYPGKPIVVTEFGYPTDKISDGINDEEKQKEVLLCDMRAMEGRISGYAIWHFADHEWEVSEDGSVFFGSKISPYGVFKRDRGPKPVADAIAAYWKGL